MGTHYIKANDSNPFRQNSAVTKNQGSTYNVTQHGINSAPAPDTSLSGRFDDPRYYTGPTSEEYVEKGY